MSIAKILVQASLINSGKMSSSGKIILPLSAFYRREDEFEKRRIRFYADCARAFQFEGWSFKSYEPEPEQKKGSRKSGKQKLAHYGYTAKATFRNEMSDPVEYLEAHRRLLNDPRVSDMNEQDFIAAGQISKLRIRMAKMYQRAKVEGEFSGLKSPDLTGMPKGGFGSVTPADHAIDQQRRAAVWEQSMPYLVRTDMNRVFYHGKFLFLEDDGKDVLERLMKGLDIIAYLEREVPRNYLAKRWPDLEMAD